MLYLQRDGGWWYAWTPDRDGEPSFNDAYPTQNDASDLEHPSPLIIADIIKRKKMPAEGYQLVPLGTRIDDTGVPFKTFEDPDHETTQQIPIESMLQLVNSNKGS